MSSTSQSKPLTLVEKLELYVTGTFILPTHSLTHVGPPLNWNDATKLSRHLGVTPVVTAELPTTAGLNESRIYDIYAKYIQDHGTEEAQAALEAGEQVIVGLRITHNTRVNQGRGVYNDRIAVIWKEAKTEPGIGGGAKLVPTANGVPTQASILKRGADFVGNTQPSAQYEDPGTELRQIHSKKTGKMITVRVASKLVGPDGKEIRTRKPEGNDVNKDGRVDLGELVPGTYSFHFGYSAHLRSYVLRGNNQQVVRRDVNHDGEFTAADVWKTDKGETVVETGDFAILIHPGSAANTFSGGCQTMPRAQFNRFLTLLNRQQPKFYYVLVTVR